MDEFHIWNVARSPEQLTTFRRIELNGDEAGLTAYYNFNDSVPKTAAQMLTISVAELPNGIYFYSLYFDNSLVGTKRMVVSH